MPYFWPSRGLQVRGLNKSSREPTELNTHSIRYEPWNMRPQASSMQDRCAETPVTTDGPSDQHQGSKRKMATSTCDDNPRVQ